MAAEQESPVVRADGGSDARAIARAILWLIQAVLDIRRRVKALEDASP